MGEEGEVALWEMTWKKKSKPWSGCCGLWTVNLEGGLDTC